jgi:hypothetical protein
MRKKDNNQSNFTIKSNISRNSSQIYKNYSNSIDKDKDSQINIRPNSSKSSKTIPK